MSFSFNVKAELNKTELDRPCCALAEAYGILFFGHTFSHALIRIVTENKTLCERLPILFQAAFGLDFDSILTPNHRNAKTIFTIQEKSKLERILSAFGYDLKNSVALHLNLAVLEEECCRSAFFRGAFLTGGSVTDPEKKYHLELVTPHYFLCREMLALLFEMDFAPRQATRKFNYVIYFKASEQIEDFLTIIGAPLSAIALMNTKVEKDFRNRINRKVNCETANLTKTVDASRAQMQAIQAIRQAGALDSLTVPLQETARLRLEHPEATLSELAAMHSEPIGKSGLNHRLRKLVELGNDLLSSNQSNGNGGGGA